MAGLWDVQVPKISKRLKNIYKEKEMSIEATVSQKEIVPKEGVRDVLGMLGF